MIFNHTGNYKHYMKQYQQYLRHILTHGVRKADRTGTGTISTFGYQMRFDLKRGFPLLTTKKIFTKAVIHELLWFLRGETNIQSLVKEGVSIWTDWPLDKLNKSCRAVGAPEYTKESFEQQIVSNDKFASIYGDLGPVYGKQWRAWSTNYHRHELQLLRAADPTKDWTKIDQIANLVERLKTNPDDRRLMVTAWNPAELDNVALPPCHYGFQCWTRALGLNSERYDLAAKMPEFSHRMSDFADFKKVPDSELASAFDEMGVPRRALTLMWNQRSVDSFLGLPFNIASYAFLTHMLAQQTNMVADEVIFSGGDCHIYINHLDQVDELLSRDPRPLPQFQFKRKPDSIFDYTYDDFEILNYDPHPAIKGEVAV